MSVTFSIGSILGPLLSGLTSEPLRQYKQLETILPNFIVKFLQKFPFIIPNLILSILCFLAFILALFSLKETNKALLAKQAQKETTQQAETQLEEMQIVGEETTDILNDENKQRNFNDDMLDEHEEDHHTLFKSEEYYTSTQTKAIPSNAMSWKEYMKQKLKPESEIFVSYAPLATVALYAVYGFVGNIFTELMPLLLVLKPEDGGLNFVQRQLGIMNAISFVFLLVWCLLFVPWIIKKLGSLRSFRLGVMICIPSIFLFPFVNYLHSTNALAWAVLIFVYVYRHAMFQLIFSSMTIMSNNSVTSASMGRLNGISQSSVAFTRSVGPVLGTSIFSLSLQVNVFPFNRYFMFILLSVLMSLLLLISAPLTANLNAPKSIPIPVEKVVVEHNEEER
jgi:MFS family permease